MSLRVEGASRKLEKASAIPSPHQSPSIEPANLAEVPNTSTSQQHRSSPDTSKDDKWTELLGEETIKIFKDLALHFKGQDSFDDIVNWDQCLLERLENPTLISQYNIWSQDYFTPRPRISRSTWIAQVCLRKHLPKVNWNVPNETTKAVSSLMIYGRRLKNNGRFPLGKFRSLWLILQLNMWAISSQDTNLDLRRQYGLFDAQPGGVLGLRYNLIGNESTRKSFLFFPLGHILFTEALAGDEISREDAVKYATEADWTKTPYILAVGVLEDGSTELDNSLREAKYYVIFNKAHNMLLRPVRTKDSDDDDDAQDDYLCRKPPAFTVASVSEKPYHFLNGDVSDVIRESKLDFDPLSSSKTEIVETTTSEQPPKECIRFGLFPE